MGEKMGIWSGVSLLLIIFSLGCVQSDSGSAPTSPVSTSQPNSYSNQYPAGGPTAQASPTTAPPTPPPPRCGDGRCDKNVGENCATCPSDCGCEVGYYCDSVEKQCLKEEVKLEAKITNVNDRVSSTLFYSLPQETLDSIDSPLVTVSVRNDGRATAEDVTVKAKIANYGEYYAVDVGDLDGGKSKTIEITPKASSKIMDLTSDTYVEAQVRVEYYDEDKNQRSKDLSKEFLILGRNSFSWYHPELISAWVTPTHESVRGFAVEATKGIATFRSDEKKLEAAERIFLALNAYGITYNTDAHTSGDYIQFPVETMNNRGGDCDDLAVLYSSLLESVGIRTELYLIPGHIFVGIKLANNKILPIEQTMIAYGDFNRAAERGIEEWQESVQAGKHKGTIHPTIEHSSGVTPVDIKKTAPLPRIDVSLSSPEYGYDATNFCFATVDTNFKNSGNAAGKRCVKVSARQSDGQYMKEELCKTLNGGESTSETALFNTDCRGILNPTSKTITAEYSILQ